MRSWYCSLRRALIDILIHLLERDLYNTPVKEVMDAKVRANFFADLFDRHEFRQYCIERETRFVHALAADNTPEVKGQRSENMLLFNKARAAHEDRQKKILSLRSDDQSAVSTE